MLIPILLGVAHADTCNAERSLATATIPLGDATAGGRMATLVLADLDGDGLDEPYGIVVPPMDGTVPMGLWAAKVRDGRLQTGPLHPLAALSVAGLRLLDGDIDGDGDLDLVLADPTRSELTRIIGLASDGYQVFPPQTQKIGSDPVLADIDGDGAAELYSATTLKSSVTVDLRTDPPQVRDQRTLQAPGFEQAVGDLDGDGKLDRVIAHGSTGRLTVAMGGNLTDAQQVSAGTSEARDLLVADIDGDGFGDVIVVDEQKSQVRALSGRTLKKLGPPLMSLGAASQGGAHAIASGDIDGDGCVDLVLHSFQSRKLGVGFGNGKGSFELHTLETGEGPMAAGDLDADGLLEIAVVAGSDLIVVELQRVIALMALGAGAQASEGTVQLRLTAFDAPYTLDGVPSMDQSLDGAYAGTRMLSFGLREASVALFDDEGLQFGLGLPVLAMANVFLGFPLSGWMHEEWHRAVMTSQGVASRNGIYHPEAWSNGLIAVDNVSDDDLARLKADTPWHTVRLMTAGLESTHVLSWRLGDEVFFHGAEGHTVGPFYASESWVGTPIAFQEIGHIQYMALCASGGDALTDTENQLRLTVPERDFTGADCLAWVYDLRRPDEPYADRGAHPYGEGVDRYRSAEDLTPDEQRFLVEQLWLGLALNALNPHLFYADGFSLPTPGDRWVLQLAHIPAPFGFTMQARAGLKRGGLSVMTEYKAHVHDGQLSPGLGARILDIELGVPRLSAEVRADVWLQPERLRFDGSRVPGGRIGLDLTWEPVDRLELWVASDGKSWGWVPGEVYLAPNVAVRSGLTGHIR